MNIFEQARYLAYERLEAWLLGTTIHRPERTLVIIDMQDYFIDKCEYSYLVPVICELIQYARQKRWAIILVEFYLCGPTNTEITVALKDYPYQATVIKANNDGGREVIKYINNRKTWSLDLLVCGVYGDECVPETVAGLFDASDLVEVDVIVDAVHPPYRSLSEKDEHGQQHEVEVVMEDFCVNTQDETCVYDNCKEDLSEMCGM